LDTQLILESIRDQALVGDIIFLGGNDLIAKLIRFAQKNQTPDGKPSLWSHVCLYLDKDMIAESTLGFEKYRNGSRWDNGVEYYSLEERIKEAQYVALVHMPITLKQRHQLKLAIEQLYLEGITYPVLGLIGSLLTYWLFPRWKNNPLDDEKKSLYCSAFVAKVYQSIGWSFSDQYAVDNVSPQLMWDSIVTNPKCKVVQFYRQQ
jgi:hypothetical protein